MGRNSGGVVSNGRKSGNSAQSQFDKATSALLKGYETKNATARAQAVKSIQSAMAKMSDDQIKSGATSDSAYWSSKAANPGKSYNSAQHSYNVQLGKLYRAEAKRRKLNLS